MKIKYIRTIPKPCSLKQIILLNLNNSCVSYVFYQYLPYHLTPNHPILLSFAFYFHLKHLPSNFPRGFCSIAIFISSSQVLRARLAYCNLHLFVSSNVYVQLCIEITPLVLHTSAFALHQYRHPWSTRILFFKILRILSRLIFLVAVFSLCTNYGFY